ncbi:hypothetical protein SprV_0200551600 [Sparganum proliferum]
MYVHFEAVEDACSSAFVSQCTRLSFFGSFCFLASWRGDSTLLTKLSFCHVPLHSKRRQGVSPGSVMANVLYLSEFLSVGSLISVLCSTYESSSLVIKDPWYTESGNYTCCYAFSNWTGNADCFSSYIVFADKTELPPNLLRDTLPQPGETPIFKGITYWQPALLLSFRPANFFKRTNFSGVHFRIREEVVSHDRRHCLVNALDNRTALAPAGPGCIAHNISTEELPCPSELLDGLHGIYEEDDFYGIRNRCFRSVLTLNYRALGQDGEYVCQVTAQEGVDVEMPIRFHFPLGYPLERLVHPRLGEGEASTCVSETLNAAHNLSRRDLANRLNACPKNALLLSWLSSNSICTGQAVELNCAWPAWQETSTNYLRMYSLSDFQTDAQLLD